MSESRILMGVIGRPHGVRGLVHVTSYADDITAYGPLSDDKRRYFVLRMRGEDVAEIAERVGDAEIKVTDRTTAERLTNTRLYVERVQLPEPEEDEFYLADLVGLTACDPTGTPLGTLVAVHDYGAGASLEIQREGAAPLLIPFTRKCVPEVDIAASRLTIELPVEVDANQPVMAGLDPAIRGRADGGMESQNKPSGSQP